MQAPQNCAKWPPWGGQDHPKDVSREGSAKRSKKKRRATAGNNQATVQNAIIFGAMWLIWGVQNTAKNQHKNHIKKLLEIGNKIGFINNYSEENAEDLSFNDESFDYVLIKEAFHHFPRPWIALYEAFRVCKKGIVLIEPNDIYLAQTGLRKRIFRRS